MKQRIIAIVQARMGSSRLPGKVLRDIHGKPMLLWVVERARRSDLIDEVVVATTTDSSDDLLAQVCRDMDIPCHRGDAFDVLDRYYTAAQKWNADVIVRLTADCPLIDADLIDQVVTRFLNEGVDFAANRLPPPYHRTFPIGLDVEVVSFGALETAWREATQRYEREHVLPFIYDTSKKFKILTVDHTEDFGDYRWTVDTPEDLQFVQEIFARIENPNNFTWLDVLDLVKREPHLMQINAEVNHKTFKDVDDRAGEISNDD